MSYKNFKTLVVFVMTVYLALSTACSHGKPLYKPEVAVTKTMNRDQIGKLVKTTLVKRGWTIVGDKPGETTAQISRQQVVAKIKVDYDPKKIRVNYLDSSNMQYRKEGDNEFVHNRYNLWVQNLERDLNNNIALH